MKKKTKKKKKNIEFTDSKSIAHRETIAYQFLSDTLSISEEKKQKIQKSLKVIPI